MNQYTYSSLSTFQRCPRLYYYKYVCGYRSTTVSKAISFGNIIHRWLASYHSCRTDTSTDISNADITDTDITDKYELAVYQAVIDGYRNKYPRLFETVYANHPNPDTEYQFDIKYKGNIISGKIDVIYYTPLGVMIAEHKTSSEDISPGSWYWQKLQLDFQIGLYAIAANMLFGKAKEPMTTPRTVLYNVLSKPKLRPLKTKDNDKDRESPDEFYIRLINHIADNPDRYYQRGKAYLSSDNLLTTKQTLDSTINAITRSYRSSRAWPCYSAGCYRYPCEFFPVCTNETTLTNTNRYRHVDHIHEELTYE